MITKLQHCTPEFVRKCCPDQSGSVIFVDDTILLLTESSVLLTSVVGVSLHSPEGESKWWWGNGQLWEHCHRVNGEFEGEFKSWYKNGQLREHRHYVNGELEGEFKEWWHGDGQLCRHCHYVNGKFVKILL